MMWVMGQIETRSFLGQQWLDKVRKMEVQIDISESVLSGENTMVEFVCFARAAVENAECMYLYMFFRACEY